MPYVDTPLPESLDLKPIVSRKVVGRPYGPSNPAKGRPKGTVNKVVRDLKEGLIVAAENIGSDGAGKDGLVGFLEDLGRYHKRAFASLLVKLLPMQVSGNNGVAVPGVTLNIMSVESGDFLSPADIERMRAGQAIVPAIEHHTEPAPEPEPAPAPQLSALESKLLAMDPAQLLELARTLNVGR